MANYFLSAECYGIINTALVLVAAYLALRPIRNALLLQYNSMRLRKKKTTLPIECLF